MYKNTAPLGFARAYPRPRRAKSGVFSIVALSAAPKSCNIRVPKLFMPVDAPPKHMSEPRQTAMFVLKRYIKVPGGVD